MGMGYAGSSALTLSDEQVAKAVGAELYQKFTDALEACPLGESELFRYDFDMDDHNDLSDEDRALVEACMEAYEAVCKAFKKATKIPISRAYHDTENDGDRYDDISGGYWDVDHSSIYTKTKKAKDMEKLIGEVTWANFVNFG